MIDQLGLLRKLRPDSISASAESPRFASSPRLLQ